MRHGQNFFTVAVAMDTLQDTSEAIEAYGNVEKAGRSEAYVLAYGVLQALYLQQDAAFWLCNLLNIRPVASFQGPGAWARTVEPLGAARTARNNSIGHPVRRDKG